jgi:hypothetical protein
MKKIFIAMLLLPIIAAAQNDSAKVDTVKTVLGITRCNTCPVQPVPGYVLMKKDSVVGYLSKLKKPLPNKITVCRY